MPAGAFTVGVVFDRADAHGRQCLRSRRFFAEADMDADTPRTEQARRAGDARTPGGGAAGVTLAAILQRSPFSP